MGVAIYDMTGSVVALAARWRNCRRGSFTAPSQTFVSWHSLPAPCIIAIPSLAQ